MAIRTSGGSVDLGGLRAAIRGRVIGPDDADFDAARTVVDGRFDRRPAAIARPVDAADVAAIVTFARDTGAELTVRSGGHSGAGHSVVDGGLVLDLRDMKGIDIDVEGRTAWAETGLTAAEVTTAVGEHGLAIGFGDTGSVGIGGITLGAGVGFLARPYGLTIDDLLAAEIVTADGLVRMVDADHEPDLFWAIRGGGGNFGLATRFHYRLHELPGIVGGMLILPATAETVAGFIAASEAAPEALTTIANVMTAPPAPFIPPEHEGRIVILGMLTYAGDEEAGTRAIAPFRALAAPIFDMVQPMPYSGMYFPEPEGAEEYHPTAAARTMFIDRVDLDVATTIVERLEASDATLRVVQLRVLGGAVARVPDDATAYAHRQSRIMANVAAFFEGPDDEPVKEAWVIGTVDALRQGDDGAYVNFLVDEGEAGVQAAYPDATRARLAVIKARYDPTNLFHHNQNIPPAAD